MVSLEKQVALITGASGEIGQAIAYQFAAWGADMILHYRKSQQKAESVARDIQSMGRNAWLVQSDLSEYDSIQSMFQQIDRITDRLDILINNAAIMGKSYARSISEQDCSDMILTNLSGPIYCSKFAFKRMMRNKGGSIVNISSVAARKAFVAQTVYAATKGGLNSVTVSLAQEFGRFNIRVNAVAPGPVQTKKSPITNEDAKQIMEVSALHRLGEAEDIAHVVGFLCSPMARHITGQIISVDGGFRL